MNTYYFQGIRWIPSYRDFDFDDCHIVAENAKEAWKKLDQQTNLKMWKTVGLLTINGQTYYEGV